MITEKTKKLFEFIDYLHTNITSFKQYDDIIVQLQNLDEQRRNLKPRENFLDKLKFDKIQNELKPKFDIIHENITLPIYKKATEQRYDFLYLDLQSNPARAFRNFETQLADGDKLFFEGDSQVAMPE